LVQAGFLWKFFVNERRIEAFMPVSAQATGIHKCEAVPQEKWLTKQELTKKLEAEGWTVRRMKPDGGCWEVYGTTPEGQRVEGYFHPATGEKLLINQRGKILFKKE
jgi:hypothetical protein